MGENACVRRARAYLLICAALCLCSGALYLVVPRVHLLSQAARRFSKYAASALSAACSVFYISVAEVIACSAAAAAIIMFVVFLVSLIRQKGRRGAYLLKSVSAALVFLSGVFYIFTLLWGLNYTARPLAESLGLDVRARQPQALVETAATVLELANEYAEKVPRDAGGMCSFGSFSDLAEKAADCMKSLGNKYTVFYSPKVSKPKAVASWYVMSSFGISGIYVPFTGEANVNPDNVPTHIPFSMNHEIAHSLGIAPEDEANFSAFLGCVESGDDRFTYSGYLCAYVYLINAVHEISPNGVQLLSERQSRLVYEDLTRLNEHIAKYKGPVSEAGDAINNRYLQAMGEYDGVHSYGRMVDLLIAYYQRNG